MAYLLFSAAAKLLADRVLSTFVHAAGRAKGRAVAGADYSGAPGRVDPDLAELRRIGRIIAARPAAPASDADRDKAPPGDAAEIGHEGGRGTAAGGDGGGSDDRRPQGGTFKVRHRWDDRDLEPVRLGAVYYEGKVRRGPDGTWEALMSVPTATELVGSGALVRFEEVWRTAQWLEQRKAALAWTRRYDGSAHALAAVVRARSGLPDFLRPDRIRAPGSRDSTPTAG